jgi:glycosyltransferase involved in cell wall biosynthesis
MKAVWVTKSFLDYRVPVYEELARRLEGRFVLLFNADYVPDRCCTKAAKALGPGARGLRGERALRLGPQNGFANAGVRIPYQPGLVRAILKERPDVLITDGFFQWTSAALWLRATRGIPHVMCYEKTAHTEQHAQWYRRTYRRLALRWIDALCCNGRLCGEYVRSLGFPADRITYGHMAADVAGLQQRLAAVTDDEVARLVAQYDLWGTVFLFVGRLIPLKGIRELLAGWQQFSTGLAGQQATLLLVGDGPQREELRRYCDEQKLANVRFAGAVDYDRMASYYRCADALVMPTLEDNWSLVVPEAMGCGLPILCSQYNGCWPELVTPANGWVFDPLVRAEVAGALRKASLAKARLPRMGEQSRVIVSDYTASHAAQAICEAIELACRWAGRNRVSPAVSSPLAVSSNGGPTTQNWRENAYHHGG